MLVSFMMANHTAGASPQHAVVAREVARHPADGCTLQATSRVCPRRHYARRQRESQNRRHQNPFHCVSLMARVNHYLDDKQMKQKKIPARASVRQAYVQTAFANHNGSLFPGR
jgi:hypothetical protein